PATSPSSEPARGSTAGRSCAGPTRRCSGRSANWRAGIPGQGPPETFAHVDARLVGERLPRLGDVRKGMAHIAWPLVEVFSLDVLAGDAAKLAENLVQGRSRSAGHVEGLAGNSVGLGGGQIRVDDVVHICEITRLLAIAK